MAAKLASIPFFPTYTIEHKAESNLVIWWFENEFSQVTYGATPERGRHACVLITLLTASKIDANAVMMSPRDENLAPRHDVVVALAEAILEGIKVYIQLEDGKKLSAKNLSVPEAYEALKDFIGNIHEWVKKDSSPQIVCQINSTSNFQTSFLYFEDMGSTLDELIWTKLKIWQNKSLAIKQYLFVILIADSRAVLIVIDQISQTVTLFDSHPHFPDHGCCIAQAELPNLRSLCRWISQMYRDCYQSNPTCFELSFFQVRQR